MGERAVRVSVAVVEGKEGPVALLPSAEEVVCPEADFLAASLEAERRAAKRQARCPRWWRELVSCTACAHLHDMHRPHTIISKQHLPMPGWEYGLGRCSYMLVICRLQRHWQTCPGGGSTRTRHSL